jgi:predicted nucleic-acid-binding Zn-ribbon protein
MKKEEKDNIINRLLEREAKLPCPRCGNTNFSLADGYFAQTVQNNLSTYILSGQTIPSVVVVCNRCGFISQHALGPLDLLPQKPESK